jgi:NADPH-dependent 2,4-dienoyl-CoA reductase/sulfur reductase-like enzyme/nitrite reductase/ring-hydroxylating ferredoxin subunit
VGEQAQVSGPDFTQGIALGDLPDPGTIAGRVGDDPVLLSRIAGELYAVGGACTHYGGALADGIDGSATVRCPLHHACFDLRTGAPLRAPALDALDRWQVEVEGERAFVRRRLEKAPAAGPSLHDAPASIVIVGGGAAGLACANELRRLGYPGAITMFSADGDPPCDRPNLSKDYLAGTAPEEWIPLRAPDWYEQQAIQLWLDTEVTAIDVDARTVVTASGLIFPFDRLLLCTGSVPNRLAGPGFDLPNVRTLRSLADAKAVIELARPGSRAAIIGSSFIGLEAAAALRTRRVAVDVVSVEAVPFERVLGPEIGRMVQRMHEEHGVAFHLGRSVASYDGNSLRLTDGSAIDADFLLVGIGVRPRLELAHAAGLALGDGVLVNAHLETSAPGIFAAGDIAAHLDPTSGRPARIEHWATAERQGQTVAANMLGLDRRFDAVPFFWTEQYGSALRYVGHAPQWDRVEIDGDLASRDFTARYYAGTEQLASATMNRDRESLAEERRLERASAERSHEQAAGTADR